MGKTQKNALLPDDLCAAVDHLQMLTGATFARVTGAAFLKYIFGPWQPPPYFDGSADEQVWMRLAVELERGNLSVCDIPGKLLESNKDVCRLALAHFSNIENPSDKEAINHTYWLKLRGALDKLSNQWDKLCAERGGQSGALNYILDTGGFPTPRPVGYAKT